MKTKLFLLCAFALALIALAACAAPTPAATPVPLASVLPTAMPSLATDPGAMVKAMVDAFNAGKVDAVVALYADDAVRSQQPPPTGQSGIWTGKDQIRGVTKGLIDDHFSVEISNLKVTGNQATYTCTFFTDTYRKLGIAPLVVTEETVFDGNKVKSQKETITPESLAKIQAAMAAAQVKAATPTAVPAMPGHTPTTRPLPQAPTPVPPTLVPATATLDPASATIKQLVDAINATNKDAALALFADAPEVYMHATYYKGQAKVTAWIQDEVGVFKDQIEIVDIKSADSKRTGLFRVRTTEGVYKGEYLLEFRSIVQAGKVMCLAVGASPPEVC